MDYSTLTSQIEPSQSWEPIDPHSLYGTFEQLPDGRKKRGRRYPLALLLTLIVLAKLAGETNISGVVDWVKHRQAWLQTIFGSRLPRWPCFTTYTYALSKLDASACMSIVAAAFTRAESESRCQDEPSRLLTGQGRQAKEHVAVDGKTLRGTLGHDASHQPSVHLLSFYEVATGVVLAQREVRTKENEISAVKEMLIPTLVKGRLLTADAMHTQRFFCQKVKELGGDYVLIAKDNQKRMHEDLALFFEDPQADRCDWQTICFSEKGHGRREKRVVTTSSQLREWFARDWVGIEQVFRVERTVKRRGKQHQEVAYGITSRSAKQADATQVGLWVRGHWSTENRNHGRRDWTLREDQSQVRTQHVPAMLALLNTTVLALMDRIGVRNVPAHMRRLSAHPHEALRLLLGKL